MSDCSAKISLSIEGPAAPAALLEVAALADRAGFESLTICEDLDAGIGKHEPLVTCAYLAVSTRSIRLVASLANQGHPYNAARRLASIDHVSGGRAGWRLPAGGDNDRKAEFAQVITGLWESWDKDALALEDDDSVRVERSKVRPLDHRGSHFAVRGPLDIPRPPQGRIPLVVTWRSHADTLLAATHAEAVIADISDVSDLLRLRQDLLSATRALGRLHSPAILIQCPYSGSAIELARRIEKLVRDHSVDGVNLAVSPADNSETNLLPELAEHLARQSLLLPT